MNALPARVYALPTPETPEIVFDVEEGHPLIPDAEYLAVCTGCEVKQTFKCLKTYFRFRITEGEQAGKILFRAFNVDGRIIPGRGPGTGPRPKLTRGSLLFKTLCRLLNLPANTKPHRVSSREIVGRLCKVRTKTVTHDYQQKPLADAGRYSVVAEILSLETE